MKPVNSLGSPALWMVQPSWGQAVGPLSTQEVLKKISSGVFRGEEKIRKYPNGNWMPISKEPIFYDHLLGELEGEGKKKASRKSEEVEFEKSKVISNEPTSVKSHEPTVAQGPMTVDLQNLKAAEKKQRINTSVIPIFLIAVASIVAVVALFWPSDSDDGKIKLIIPQRGIQTVLNQQQITEQLKGVLELFEKDMISYYLESQTRLVQIIHQAPLDKFAVGYLCFVQKELWPFTKQSSKDLEAIYASNRIAFELDPLGLSAALCETAKLMVLGKYKDALGRIDEALKNPSFSNNPMLYLLKAEIAFADKDVRTAAAFAEWTAKYWTEWTKSYFSLGQYLVASTRYNEAGEALKKALLLNPQHKGALIEMGALLNEFLQRPDLAETYLAAAFNSQELIIRTLEAKANMNMAQIYIKKNESNKALEHAQRAFELNPGDYKIKQLLVELGGSAQKQSGANNNELIYIGDQYYRAGDFLSAQAEYKTAFELDPRNAWAATKAAKSLWQLNQATEAISWLDKAIAADPKLAMAYYLQADYYSDRYDFNAALKILQKGVGRLPNNLEILRGYGLVELRRNNIKPSIGYLERALKIYDSDVETLILLSKAYGKGGEYQKADQTALRARQLDSTNNEAHVVYAKNLVQFRGLDAGLLYIKNLVSTYSYTVEFLLAIADMNREAGRHSDAQQYYKETLAIEPKNKKAFLGLGQTQKALGQFEEARKSFFSAAQMDPSDAEALVELGMLYYESGKNADAISMYKRALLVNVNYPKVRYFLGKAAFQQKDYDQALAAAAEEKKNNPNLADSYFLSGDVYYALKHYDKCAEELQKGVQLRPQGAENYVKLSRCFRLAGNLDLASNMLTLAAGQESGYADIYREQGQIYEQKVDRRAAAAAYNKYLTLSPNAPDRVEIENRILSMGSGQ